MKISYQGINGAYSQMAAEEFIAEKGVKSFETIGCRTFEEVFEGVNDGIFKYGIVPVENSLAGSIYRTFDLLSRFDIRISGEIYLKINHYLLATKGTDINEIEEIYSHWQALNQCEYNIKKTFPNAKIIEFYDTAGSAEMISKKNDKKKAAIASKKAGKLFGLQTIKKDFQDDKDNYTRFLIISKEFASFDTKSKHKHIDTQYKTSLIFAGRDVTGFLFKALACFSLRDINLTKIESRPVPKSPWQNYFYLDFEGKFDDEKVRHAIENLREVATEVKVLGSYQAYIK